MRRISHFIGLGIVLCSGLCAARPNLWDAARDPKTARAEALLAAADRARIPADPTVDGGALQQKLNERSALMIQMAGGEELGDARLLYLLGDCLVHASGQHYVEGRNVLRRALAMQPDSAQAARAWFSIAISSSMLGDHQAEHAAYTAGLELEWEREARARTTLNRAESNMAVGKLNAAVADYRAALRATASSVSIALGKWGLGVALDRSRDWPAAIPFLVQAAQSGFGPRGNQVAIDLDDVFFTPSYEIHYYRALSQLALASQSPPTKVVGFLQSAKLLWLNYIAEAPQDGPWVGRARQHLQRINRQLDELLQEDD